MLCTQCSPCSAQSALLSRPVDNRFSATSSIAKKTRRSLLTHQHSMAIYAMISKPGRHSSSGPTGREARARRAPDRSSILYGIWKRLRGPFVFPPNIRCHDCIPHFESFDSDMAGCRLCGALHQCSVHTCKLLSSDDAHVCSITGLCLHTRIIQEWQPGVGHLEVDPSNSVSKLIHGPQDIQRWKTSVSKPMENMTTSIYFRLLPLLDSAAARSCLAQDHSKATQVLKSVLGNFLRTSRRMGCVNWVNMEALLHTTVCQHRIPVRRVSQTHVKAILDIAVPAIATLLGFVNRHCSPLPSCLKNSNTVVGLLYQCRAGITIYNTVILPRIPLLAQMLPNEQHLASNFDVRAKTIAEAENAVKLCLRQLPSLLIANYAQRATE